MTEEATIKTISINHSNTLKEFWIQSLTVKKLSKVALQHKQTTPQLPSGLDSDVAKY